MILELLIEYKPKLYEKLIKFNIIKIYVINKETKKTSDYVVNKNKTLTQISGEEIEGFNELTEEILNDKNKEIEFLVY